MNFATVPFLRSPDIIASGPKCGYHHCFVRVLSLFNSLRHCQCSLSGLSSVSLYWWGFVCKSATYGMLHLGHLKVSHLYINNFKIIFQQSDCLHYKSSPLILLLDSLCWIIHRGFVELISILSSHLPLCFPSDLFPDLLRSRCYIYALSPPNVCCMLYHSHAVWFGHPYATGEECNLWSFSVCNYLNFLLI